MRSNFIKKNNLNDNFRFDLYLKYQIQHVLIEVLEISWVIWVILFILSFTIFFFATFINRQLLFFLGGLELLIAAGIFSFIISIFMYVFFTISHSIYINYNRFKYIKNKK
jgi:hypothetical protein